MLRYFHLLPVEPLSLPIRWISKVQLGLPARLAANFIWGRTDPAFHWMNSRELEELGLGRNEDGRYGGLF